MWIAVLLIVLVLAISIELFRSARRNRRQLSVLTEREVIENTRPLTSCVKRLD
jgi:hypothetical protein